MNATNSNDRLLAWLSRWPLSLALLGVAGVAVSWRLAQAWQGVDLFCDDAYYYTVIARNFVETGRFTFDGSSLTNGFHPLLFWVEAAGFAIFGTEAPPMSQYLCILLGSAAVFLSTVGGCLWVTQRKPRSAEDAVVEASLLIALCAILVPRFTKPYLGGMEAILVLPLLILLGTLAWRGRYGLAGISGLLLVMARLDTLPYVVVPLGLACAYRERSRRWGAIRSGLLVLFPAVIGTVALMSWHRWIFTEPMPIHGVLKSCFPAIHFQWHQVFARASDSITLMFALGTAVAAIGLLLREGSIGKDARGAGLTAAGLGLLQLAVFTLFQKWSKPIPVWYVGPAVLMGTFALAVGVANTVGQRRLRGLTVAAGVVVVGLNLASISRAWYRGSSLWKAPPVLAAHVAGESSKLVAWMKELPEDHVWAGTDCGKLAFWSGRRVVNLDGLVNDFKYQDHLRDGRLARYLRERNVKYLVFPAWDRPQAERGRYEPMYEHRVAPALFSAEYEAAEFYVYSYKYLAYSDKVSLPCTAEVWRSAAVRDGRAMCKTIIFDLDLALGHGAVAAIKDVATR